MAVAEVRRRPSRDYPPLLIAGVLLLAILVVLPSSLNLPQSSPSQTLEYAPVPPEDEDSPPPPSGNLGALSLAGSANLGGSGGDAPGGGAGGGAQPGGAGKNPSTKRCVGNPPRQTEDPLSPPCVAHFAGDNGGATAQGVTAEEVRVVVYFEGCATQSGGSRGREPLPCSTYIDMLEPPPPDENTFARTVRIYQQYFNDRYQTYGRFVHFWAYFDGGPTTAETRRADAADHVQKLDPFAAFVGSAFGYISDWEEVLLRRGVHVFRNSQSDRANCCAVSATFRKFAPLLWSVAASAEQYADIFAGAVCGQVVDRPVTFSGMTADQGKPRILGLIRDNRKGYEGGAVHGTLSRDRIVECGAKFVAEAVSDGSCDPNEASAAMASFRDAGVTTIVWPTGPQGGDQCSGLNYANSAAAMAYYPEVVVAGNGLSEITLNGQTLPQQFWRNAFVVTPYTRADVVGERPCIQAIREVDPGANIRDTENISCTMYDVFRFLFTGIQVSGPRLTSASMDKGFHAIPAVSSEDPRVPACFFETGDYTCVKDAMIVWWDPSGRDPGSSAAGCMRMLEGGRRYLAGEFPQRDIADTRRADDPCNRQGTIIA